MAYIPSHQELKDHPKTRRAARRCGVSIPTMVGHLHLLWWWALDHGPDGDLSRFESEDLADAAMWEGDPEEFVKALVDCGPGGSEGFLTSSGMLHDWADYGGKYGQRVKAARKAAAVRWQCSGNADASDEPALEDSESEGNADAVRTHSGGSAEERRGEERRETTTSDVPSDPEVSEDARVLTREFAVAVKANGHGIPTQGSKARDKWLIEMDRLLRLGPPGEGGHVPDVAEVRKVVGFVTTDSFEMANVQSVPKLRERYASLRLKALNGGGSHQPKTVHHDVCSDCGQALGEKHNQETCDAFKSGLIRGY